MSAVEGFGEAFVVFNVKGSGGGGAGEICLRDQAVFGVATLDEFLHGADDAQCVAVIVHGDIHQRGGQIDDGGGVKNGVAHQNCFGSKFHGADETVGIVQTVEKTIPHILADLRACGRGETLDLVAFKIGDDGFLLGVVDRSLFALDV